MLVEERIQLIRCDQNLRFVVHSILFCELNSKITINRTIDSTKYKLYITSYGVLILMYSVFDELKFVIEGRDIVLLIKVSRLRKELKLTWENVEFRLPLRHQLSLGPVRYARARIQASATSVWLAIVV